MNELAAVQATTAKCPGCGARCGLQPQKRRLNSVDSAAEVAEPRAYCPGCRRFFFPLREALGLNAREQSPGLVERIAFAAAETRSFERAALVLRKVGDATVSDNTVLRVAGDLGLEPDRTAQLIA